MSSIYPPIIFKRSTKNAEASDASKELNKVCQINVWKWCLANFLNFKVLLFANIYKWPGLLVCLVNCISGKQSRLFFCICGLLSRKYYNPSVKMVLTTIFQLQGLTLWCLNFILLTYFDLNLVGVRLPWVWRLHTIDLLTTYSVCRIHSLVKICY